MAVDGLLALAAETLVHLNAEHRVDDHFEGTEANGADDDTCWHLAIHEAIERESVDFLGCDAVLCLRSMLFVPKDDLNC